MLLLERFALLNATAVCNRQYLPLTSAAKQLDYCGGSWNSFFAFEQLVLRVSG